MAKNKQAPPAAGPGMAYVLQNGTAPRFQTVVPAWQDLTVWHSVFTGADMERLQARLDSTGDRSLVNEAIWVIIYNAETEDGQALFGTLDRHDMMQKTKYSVLIDLYNKILSAGDGAGGETPADAKEAVDTDPT